MVKVITWLLGLWVICHMALYDKRINNNDVLIAFIKAIKAVACSGMIIALIAILFRH